MYKASFQNEARKYIENVVYYCLVKKLSMPYVQVDKQIDDKSYCSKGCRIRRVKV